MGRGTAAQAVSMWPALPHIYGQHLLHTKQQPHALFQYDPGQLILLPVKYHWRDKADFSLIVRNLHILKNQYEGQAVYLPLLGCGFGELEEADVLPLIKALPDNFTLVRLDQQILARYAKTLRPGARKDRLFYE